MYIDCGAESIRGISFIEIRSFVKTPMENKIFAIDHKGHQYDVCAAYRGQGEEMLLLIHGLGCAKASFKDIWARDEFKPYSILAVDLIGFGDSSKSPYFSYKIEDHAIICAKVLNALPSKNIHIIAHSMGGAIGLLLPPSLLASVKTFSNLEGNLSIEDCGIVSKRTASVSFEQFETKLLSEFKELALSLGEGRFFLDSSMPLGFYKSAGSLVQWSASGQLLARFIRLSCKKAYFYGEQNTKLVALHRLDTIQKIMISGSGHFMMNDKPDELYGRLFDFVNSA